MQPSLLLYSHHTDNELIRKIQGGNAAPYEVLIRRHIRTMYRIARACGATPYRAEQQSCETLTSTYGAITGFDPRNSFRTEAVSQIMAAMAEAAKQPLSPVYVSAGDIEEDLPSVAESAHFTSTEAALDALPLSHRLAFVLCEEEGFSVPEAAAILRTDPVRLGERLERARREVGANGFRMAVTSEVYSCPMERIDAVAAAVMEAVA